MIEIGTSWVGSSPVTTAAGWWSPRAIDHEISVAVVLHEGDQGVHRVFDGLSVGGLHQGRVAPHFVRRCGPARAWG